jgi:hypothetical protein
MIFAGLRVLATNSITCERENLIATAAKECIEKI